MNDISDIDLVKKVKQGDIMAFEVLVRRYEMKLYYFLKKRTKEDHIAEEVVQDALFKIYKNIWRVDEKKGFAPYLYTIAKNELVNRFKKEKLTLTLIDEVVGIDGEKLYEDLYRKNIQEKITFALRRLKKKQREVLKLYFFDELSYKKIGEKMGVPLNTIKTNIRRAKNALLKILNHEKK